MFLNNDKKPKGEVEIRVGSSEGDSARALYYLCTVNIYFAMDSQPPTRPWERRIPGSVGASLNYR